MAAKTARKGLVGWPLLAFSVAAGLVLGTRDRSAKARSGPSEKADEAPFGEERSSEEPRWKQSARAQQKGRGRQADSPAAIPWRGWKDIFLRTYEEMGKDRLFAVAAGVVFYALLALFPAVTALVSSYGLFADWSTVSNHLEALAGLMPAGSFAIVQDQITRITSGGPAQLTFAFVFSLGLAVWSANAGMKAIFDALNVVYEEEEKRSFIKLNAISLAFTLGALASALVAVAAVVVFPLALTYLGAQGYASLIVSVLRWPLMFVLIVFGLALLYRYGPSRHAAEWRWVSVGSAAAALAWIGGSLGFSFYLSNFADYNATYGSLGAVIGLMIWMWLSVVVILLGAELNAEMEHQTARDSTQGRDKPMGTRGAVMADTVGKAKT